MILDLILLAVILIAALIVNRMLSKWHDETIKVIRREEDNLRRSMSSAVREQKKALVRLRELKTKLVNLEQAAADSNLDFKGM